MTDPAAPEPPPGQPGRPFWPRRSPAFLELRRAVRPILADGDVVVGLSGGPDSLALTAACIAEARRRDRERPAPGRPGAAAAVHAVVVDHRLQPGSAGIAAAAAATARRLGGTAEIRAVEVIDDGAGPEAAARAARYAALGAAAARLGRPLLLGHTLDDQAETVLLALARGSGNRALAGMAPRRAGPGGVELLRPLLGLRRGRTRAACAELGLAPWRDPHNDDPRFTRVRVRHRLLPALERELGPAAAANLARTAELARADADLLDGLAAAELARIRAGADPGADPAGLPAAAVAALHPALRSRVLAAWARGAGAGALTSAHLAALDRLAAAAAAGRAAGGRVRLPGGLVVGHNGGTLAAGPGAADGGAPP